MNFDAISRGLTPLGSLAPRDAHDRWSAHRHARSPEIPNPQRVQIADYLRRCPIFFAWMEYTRDEIGSRFGVSGGSSIASDGKYYWRLDAAEYVEEYGTPIPAAALRHFEGSGWSPPEFDESTYSSIYCELERILGEGEVVG